MHIFQLIGMRSRKQTSIYSAYLSNQSFKEEFTNEAKVDIYQYIHMQIEFFISLAE